MEKNIPEIEARDILSTYEGSNNVLLEYKRKFIDVKNFKLTRPQSEYVIKYKDTVPKVAKKYINIVSTFGEKIMEDRLLPYPPEKVWCEKLLCDSDKAFHIWGKIIETEQNHAMWLPKAAILQEEKKLNRVIDYSPYNNRPPMEHQKVAIEKLLANDKFILADDMGLGKSTSAVIASMESGAKKVLIVCPASLKINWDREIKNYTDRKVLIVEGRKWGSTFDYYIINYDILKNYHTTEKSEDSDDYKLLVNEKFDLAIVDECFTYDTKIMTDKGEMLIGDIVENGIDCQIVSYNFNTKKIEYKKINRWIKKHKDTIYQIKLQNGVFIECTDNHKFYTNNRGYVKAKELTTNDDLYLLSETVNKKTNLEEGKILFKELFYDSKQQNEREKNNRKIIQKRMPELWKNNGIFNGKTNDKKKIMFNELFHKNNYEQSINKTKKKRYHRKKRWMVSTYEKYLQKQSSNGIKFIEKNEKKQPNDEHKNCGKNETKINRKNIFIKRRTWSVNRTPKNTTSIIGEWVGNGISSKNKRSKTVIQKFTTNISGGYREQKIKNINRNRRKVTQIKKMEIFRQKENRSIKFIRVESIKILERGSYDKSTEMHSKNTRVYDLEIEENHNYFINNILVSNCHMVSNPTANRTRLLNDVLETIPRVWLLTGTPMTSRPINYFNLLKIVDSPLALNWQAYVRRYCKGYQFSVGNRKVWNTSGASNLDELRERTKSYVLRRMKTDILDLPEKIVTPVFVELTSKMYDEELEEFTRISNDKKDNETISITLNRLMKIRQLIAYEKIPYTCEIIDKCLDQGKKVIVFTNFTMSLDMLHEKYKKNSVILNGSMSKEKKQDAVDRFQNENKVKIFISNIVAGGVGITLTEGEVVIMNDLSFVPAHHSQAEDRAYRYGQKNSVLVYYPIFENTVEKIIYNILQKKKGIIDQVMGDGEYSESFSRDLIKSLL